MHGGRTLTETTESAQGKAENRSPATARAVPEHDRFSDRRRGVFGLDAGSDSPVGPTANLIAAVTAWLGYGLVWVPQVALSLLAARSYARNLGLGPVTRRVMSVDGALVGLLLGGYLLAWGVGRVDGAGPDWVPRLLAAVLAAGLVGLNLFYALQILLVRVWCEPLRPSHLPTFLPQLRSLVAAVGPAPYGLLLAIAAAAAGMVGAAWRLGPSLDAWLRLPAPVARRVTGLVGPAALTFVAAGLGAVIARRRGRGGVWQLAAQHDPLLAFWLWPSAPRGDGARDYAADLVAQRDYPPDDGRGPTRTVIVIVVDCWRWDHLSVNGYARPTTPFLEELAAAGRLHAVERAIAVSNASRPGIMGVLASRQADGVHSGNFRLHDVLKTRGYRTHFLLSGDHTAFENLRACYGPNIDVFFDGLSPEGGHTVNDDRRIVAAIGRLPPADGTPAFFHLHLMSPHEIGVLEPEAMRWPAPGARLGLRSRLDDPARAVDAYDNGVLQADRHLRSIFAALEARGYMRDALIALTADHGQSLGEHGRRGHRTGLYEPELRVPLFFVESGDFNYGRLPFASQVDIAPTLLDRLGLPGPSSWAGHSLLRRRRRCGIFTCSSAAPWSGLIESDDDRCLKYLFRTEAGGTLSEEVYDLLADPGELRDLRPTIDPGVLARLRRMAAGHFPHQRSLPR